MPTAATDTAARTIDEQFLDLICSDTELLAAEFDAIIATHWSTPPASPGARGTADAYPGGGAAPHATHSIPGLVSRLRHPDVGGWARQRSPPPRQQTPSDKKGR